MKAKGKHYQRFDVEFEAWIMKREDISCIAIYTEPKAFRACVRCGKEMHWNWFDNVKSALVWIESWKQPLK